MFIRNAWYVAAWADEIGEAPLARRICNEPVVLFRDRQDRAAALLDMCCHRGAPLHMGQVVEEGIQCGYHGLIFDRSGNCVSVPGQEHILERTRVRSFPVVEQDAFVWIWMGDPAKADVSTIVPWPYHNDAKNWPHKHTMYPIKAAAMLMVDNLMDLTHLGYVHTSTIGGNPSQHVEAKMQTERTPLGLKFTRWMLNSVPPPTYVKAVGFEGRIDRCQRFEFIAPGSVLQWTGAAEVGRLSRRRHQRQPAGVPAVPRPDAGDRHDVLLFLVGRERFPPGRSGGDGAVLHPGRARRSWRTRRWWRASSCAWRSWARPRWWTSRRMRRGCTCAGRSSGCWRRTRGWRWRRSSLISAAHCEDHVRGCLLWIVSAARSTKVVPQINGGNRCAAS